MDQVSARDAIGGYFELELPRKGEWHSGKLKYFSIREGLRVLLQNMVDARGRSFRLWLPRFLCPSVGELMATLQGQVSVSYYGLNARLDPLLDSSLRADDVLYVYNVFGLRNRVDCEIPDGSILDSAHAFFSPPPPHLHTFFSPRKFFGVPDGAYVASERALPVPSPVPVGARALYLLKRIDEGPEAGFAEFQSSEATFSLPELRGMSHLSRRILQSIDYAFVKEQRRRNFLVIHDRIGSRNELGALIDVALDDPDFVPFMYPFLVEGGEFLRQQLVSERIYTPCLWAGLTEGGLLDAWESRLVVETVHLPIDQRYSEEDMERVLSHITANASQ